MNCFIIGLPGAGKGIYSVMRMEDVLRSTDKHIVTNFAVELDPWCRRLGRRRSRGEKGFLAYLHDKYGDTFDAEKRIHVIDDEQMKDFYTWRVTPEGQLIQVEHKRDSQGRVSSIDKATFQLTLPTYYLMDEGWKYLNARGWQKLGEGFQFYMAQHRKAGDDIDITAQHASQIDKQARVLVQEYHTLVNHRFRMIGIFKQPNVISVVITNEPPEHRRTVGATPKIIKFDNVGIGGSFDTAKGAGVTGFGGDIERKRKGLPVWGIPLLVLLIGGGLYSFARGLGWGAGKMLVGGFESKPVKTIEKSMPRREEPVVSRREERAASVGPASSGAPAAQKERVLAITGWTRWDGRDTILLNDGTIVKPGDGRCRAAVQSDGVALIDGKVVTWERKPNVEKGVNNAWR